MEFYILMQKITGAAVKKYFKNREIIINTL